MNVEVSNVALSGLNQIWPSSVWPQVQHSLETCRYNAVAFLSPGLFSLPCFIELLFHRHAFKKKSLQRECRCSVRQHRLFSTCLCFFVFFCGLVVHLILMQTRPEASFTHHPVSLILLALLIFKLSWIDFQFNTFCYKGSYMTFCCFNACCTFDVKYC